MNILEYNLEELDNAQVVEIAGGGIFFDLGVAVHVGLNSLSEFFDEHPTIYVNYSHQGL